MSELLEIKNKIESMDYKNQIEILKIFNKFPQIQLNENNNGTFINITNLEESILKKLKEKIYDIENQLTLLNKDEIKKSVLEETFFKSS